jgi:ribonuclease Z
MLPPGADADSTPLTRARVVFLGTGGALNPERYQASLLVEADGIGVLLDAGGGLGVVRRILAASIDPASIGHIFLSHRHLDHVGGLEPFLLSLSLRARIAGTVHREMRLYASRGTATAVRAMLAAADASAEWRFGDRLAWLTPPMAAPVALTSGIRLTLTAVDHLPIGGEASACVLDLGGVRVAYSGDTRPCPALAEAAHGVDLLIHEVGGLDARMDTLHAVGHSTAGDAGRIAAQAEARALALTHLPASHVYRQADLLEEARRFAPSVEVFLAEDGLVRRV